MFPPELLEATAQLLADLKGKGLVVATAESCTGGLVAGLISSIPGASDSFDRGFITYSNTAKVEMLGIAPDLIREHGAVSAEVAAAMAIGALHQAQCDATVSITGVAGPGGGTAEKPVGLVYLGAARRDGRTLVSKCKFDDQGRDAIRLAAVKEAVALLGQITA